MQYTSVVCENCGAVFSGDMKALRLKKRPDTACDCGCKKFRLRDDRPHENQATDLPICEYRRLA